MAPPSPLLVKIATEDWEFDEIHRLNHRTFAEEIPQHPAGSSRRLVDRFHDENTYVIGLAGTRLAGMLAIRDRRPFSLEQRLSHLDAYLPAGRSICELRLLAVDRRNRAGLLLPALLECAWRHIVRRGFDLAIISALTRQLRLYRHLGFEPFGPLVGHAPDVLFQPMMITLEQFAPRAPNLFRRSAFADAVAGNFLPGPVAIHEDVRRAFEHPPQSHRSAEFLAELAATKAALGELVGAARIEILLGSGTMANDAVAGQLALDGQPGLILSNGEFGERLVDHSRRAGLVFDVVGKPWGEALDLAEIEEHLARSPSCRWLWFVHSETSTGVLNDLDRLGDACRAARVKLCVDAISSIGTVPVRLADAYLASGVSGKGLGAYPGLSMVFYDHEVFPAPTRLPRLLDLGLYAREAGVPFTHSSNLVHALHAALRRGPWDARFRKLADTSAWLRTRLARLGFTLVGSTAEPSPGVVTIALPDSLSSLRVSAELERRGCFVGAHSRYLIDRNWIQICHMGEVSRDQLSAVSIALLELVGDQSRSGRSAAGDGVVAPVLASGARPDAMPDRVRR